MKRLTIVIPVVVAFAAGVVCGTRLDSAEAQRARPLNAKACRVELVRAQSRATAAEEHAAEAVAASIEARAQAQALRDEARRRIEQLEKEIGVMVGDDDIK